MLIANASTINVGGCSVPSVLGVSSSGFNGYPIPVGLILFTVGKNGASMCPYSSM